MRFLTIPILLVVIWQAGGLLVTTLIHQQVEEALAQGVAAKGVREPLLLAYRIDARHPRTLLLLSQASGDPQDSLDYVKRLTEIEPQVARHWVALLNARARVGLFNDDTAQALRRASALGPYEPIVQLELLKFGARHWLDLSYEMRQIIIDTGERAITTQAPHLQRELRAVLSDRGLLSLVCARGIKAIACADIGQPR